MLVRFTKGPVAAKADTLTCVREDGTVTTREMPRQGVLPQAAIAFVVEAVLGWRDASFGALAGESARSSRTPGRGPANSAAKDHAAQAAALVACLQAEQWGGASDPASFNASLAAACREHGAAPLKLTPDTLQEIRTALREFGAAWRPLPPGGTLEREF